MKFAARINRVSASLTLAISAKAKAMKTAGLDVCSFSAGEPDFETPAHIKAAAKQALDEGKTRYGPSTGEPALRAAIAAKLSTENHLPYTAENIAVTNGGKQSLYNLTQVLIEAGDEVIIPAPYWVSYPDMVELAGGTPVIVPTTVDTGYKITPAQLRQAITPRTKLIIFNSPSNPSGMVYHPDEVRALAEVIVAAGVLVVADEIYERILYDGVEHLSIGAAHPDIFDLSIVSNGFAKSYAMTGWRVGYLAGAPELIQATAKLQGHSTSNVCTFAQYGAIAALTSPQDCVETMRQAFAERRTYMLQALNAMPGIVCPEPQGAFYMFPDISAVGIGSMDFCTKLLEAEHVATIPGIGFGADHNFRLSYATDLDTIKRGMERLDRFVRSLL